jgi:protein-disulfide isomerase
MAKNRRRRRIQSNYRKKKQQQSMFVWGFMGLVALAIIGGIAYSFLNQAPEVSAERLELEAYVGAEDAEVTVYEYGAYGCHACQSWHRSTQDSFLDLLEQDPYRDRVRFVFVNMPVIAANDPDSAEAAQCALDQGQDAFWDYHNALFELGDSIYGYNDDEDFVSLAGRTGLDAGELEECLDNRTHERTVEHHEERGRELGVNSTPTFFINGRRVRSDYNSLVAAINAELGL